MIDLMVAPELNRRQEYDHILLGAVRRALVHDLGERADLCHVTLSLVVPERIRDLNAQWRGVDKPTDVLSFPTDTPPESAEDRPVALGDIVIAPECVEAALGAGFLGGVVLCAVHGTLHLLGYCHDTHEQERVMFALQQRLTREVLEG